MRAETVCFPFDLFLDFNGKSTVEIHTGKIEMEVDAKFS